MARGEIRQAGLNMSLGVAIQHEDTTRSATMAVVGCRACRGGRGLHCTTPCDGDPRGEVCGSAGSCRGRHLSCVSRDGGAGCGRSQVAIRRLGRDWFAAARSGGTLGQIWLLQCSSLGGDRSAAFSRP